MSRRSKCANKRVLTPDPVYRSEVLQKLVNVIMMGGKKNAARKIVYDAMDILTKKFSGDKGKALELFNRSFQQIVPIVEVRSRRVGGSVYQIPREVSFERGRALALRWIIGAAKVRSNKTMGERLAYELIDASEGRGVAVKKKADVHRMAEANRAFSHYSW
jgi:small subunit ribosomal protein S7